MPWFVLFLLLLAVMEAFPREAKCMSLPNIYWNTTNPIFRIDNTDHIIDVNKGNTPFQYDQVDIICPVYKTDTHPENEEKYVIYNASKEEYDTCRITNPNPKVVAVCNNPRQLLYFTITFRSFTPQPGGLEFQPGQNYYFISTSSKDDLHRRIGGRCSTHNMKVMFKVCCSPDEKKNLTMVSRPHSLPGPKSTTTMTPVPLVPVLRSSTTAPLPPLPTARPVPPKELPETPTHSKPSNKKSSEYDKHPNEVVKNEELTYNSARSSLQVRWWSSYVLPAIWVLMYVRYVRR